MTIDELYAAIDDKQPPAPLEDLASFERAIGHTLPDDYRQFLVACNGGHIGGSLWFKGPTPEGLAADAGLHHVGGFREENYFSLDDKRKCYAGRIPAALVWVADDPFGNAICVGVNGPHRGRVYFWDHENEPGDDWDGAVESAGNLQLLANSFTEFVAGLAPSGED
ncbi:MAG: SMI1/KNR4 family protein [Gemmataceae bacterium]|nr:SMI1/KNR4 family protein [Gemmataceae bacterium]